MEMTNYNIPQIAQDALNKTKVDLEFCIKVLQKMPPHIFLGAGLNLISLSAKQRLLESLQSGENELNWQMSEKELWLFRHYQEVNALYDYCACVKKLSSKTREDEIARICCGENPEANIWTSLLTEGARYISKYFFAR